MAINETDDMRDDATKDGLASEVIRLIGQVASVPPGELIDGLLLGSGLGLDSVGIVELILACEQHFDVVLPAELFEGTDLPVGVLIDCIRRARELE